MRRWPDWMPIPQKSGYSVQSEDRRTKSDFGVFGEIVDEYGMEECQIECSLVCSQVQTAWLESFELELLTQGTEWFEMPLLTGKTITWHKVRFKDRISCENLDSCMYTQVNLRLELDDGPKEAPGTKEIPNWPSNLPFPQQNDFSYQPYDRREFAQMEVGTLRRVEYRIDETNFKCVVIMTRAEVETLRQFIRKDLKGGTRWFLMPLQSSSLVDMHTARLKTMPRIEPYSGLHMKVTFDLDVWRRENPMCSWVTELFICRSPARWVDWEGSFDDILNSINPELPDFWIPGACTAKKLLYEWGF